MTPPTADAPSLANLSDPDLALSEQFCLTRTYPIGKGEDMVAKVQGLTQAQVDRQCDAFGPALAQIGATRRTGATQAPVCPSAAQCGARMTARAFIPFTSQEALSIRPLVT
ncbi:MAG: hypothetical protein ACNA7Q_15600 [Rhodobacterales bacterium]